MKTQTQIKFPKEDEKPQKRLRYYCDACTGRAFYTVDHEVFENRTCQNCGMPVRYNANNYFIMSEEEKAKVN